MWFALQVFCECVGGCGVCVRVGVGVGGERVGVWVFCFVFVFCFTCLFGFFDNANIKSSKSSFL